MEPKVPDATNPCAAEYTTAEFEHDGARAGWRSTAIPCSNATVVYKVDSVVRVTRVPFGAGQSDMYLMFAVQCDGRGIGAVPGSPDAIDHDRAGGDYRDCSICSPDAACLVGEIPRTRYVFFMCREAEFQRQVWGPFDAVRAIPDRDVQEWIGVPQAFMDPDERFLFLYVHPQPNTHYAGAGLHCAPIASVRSALATILADTSLNITGQGGLPPLDATLEAQQRWGGLLFSSAFTRLGELLICLRPLELVPDFRVDEHFVFCQGRLHLFFTYKDPTTPNSDGSPRLRAIWHASAWEPFDAKRLERALEEGFELSTPELFSGASELDMTNRLTVTSCEPLNILTLMNSLQTQFDDGSEPEDVQVNDPTVESLYGDGRRMAMFFHSAAARALMVALSPDACSLRSCNEGDQQIFGQPEDDSPKVQELELPQAPVFAPEPIPPARTWRDWTLPPRYG